jgi:hypothetical protein
LRRQNGSKLGSRAGTENAAKRLPASAAKIAATTATSAAAAFAFSLAGLTAFLATLRFAHATALKKFLLAGGKQKGPPAVSTRNFFVLH